MRVIAAAALGATLAVGCQIVSGLDGLDEVEATASGTSSSAASGAAASGGGGSEASGGGTGASGSGTGASGGGACALCSDNDDCNAGAGGGPEMVCLNDAACECRNCGEEPSAAEETCNTSTNCLGEATCNETPNFCLLTCDGASPDGSPCKMPPSVPIVLDATKLDAQLQCTGPICNDKTIQCIGSYRCLVSCSGNESCDGLTVECGDGPCSLECQNDFGQGCPTGTRTLECGANACDAQCQSPADVTVTGSTDACSYVAGTNCNVTLM